MERRYWTLLALNFAGGEGLTPVQLQKSLFLLGQLADVDEYQYYDFVPYNYGPFDKSIYTDAELLESENLIEITRPAFGVNQYTVTYSGQKTIQEIQDNLSADILELMEKIVSFVKRLSFQQLLRFIYKEFPQYKENSVFQE